MNPKVDEYLEKIPNWKEELQQLRMLILECGFTEEIKWGVPCYTFKNSNIIMLGNFKDHCLISFVKGVLLQDTEGILIQQTENSQSVRVIKFTNKQQIVALAATLKAYMYEAIEIEKAGLKVVYKSNENIEFCEELQQTLAENIALKSAFDALTPGRQRAYNMHFSQAKQTKTRFARIESSAERILSGKGLNDCVCGLSKRMPSCDGSHKFLKS